MPNLKKWLQEKLQRNKENAFIRDPLPFLPIDRPSILTPSPSREDLASPIGNYGTFQRLPYEIRRIILIEAFGERTLHVDLTYDHPLVRRPELRTTTHCGLNSDLVPNTELRQSWQWFSCVCHRRVEELQSDGGVISIQKINPCLDKCLIGKLRACECEAWKPGSRPAKCFIGVMGWLLACRQAYVDGIDILFTTNTFHMSAHDLLQDLPRMLLPQRLNNITSLEMIWDFRTKLRRPKYADPLQDLWDNPETEDSALHALCQMVPKTFPHVRHLYISLQYSIVPPYEVVDPISAAERIILGPIENMLLVIGPGREFNIAIQVDAWDVLYQKHRYLHGPHVKCKFCGFCDCRFWKSLGPGDKFGYWICMGFDEAMSRVPNVQPSDQWGLKRRGLERWAPP